MDDFEEDQGRQIEHRIAETCAAEVLDNMNDAVDALEGKLTGHVANAMAKCGAELLDIQKDNIDKLTKNINHMFCVVMVTLVIMTMAIVGTGYVLYNVQVTVVVHHTTNIPACNCPVTAPVAEPFNKTEHCPVMDPVTEPVTNTTSVQCPMTESVTKELTRIEQSFLFGALLLPTMSPMVTGAVTVVASFFGY